MTDVEAVSFDRCDTLVTDEYPAFPRWLEERLSDRGRPPEGGP